MNEVIIFLLHTRFNPTQVHSQIMNVTSFTSIYAIVYVQGEKILYIDNMVNDTTDSLAYESPSSRGRLKPVLNPFKNSIIKPARSEIIP